MDRHPGNSDASRAALDSPGGAGRALAGVRRGQRGPFDTLYRVYFPWLVTLVQAISRRDESFALDVVQEVMMKLIRHTPTCREKPELEAWLRQCALTTVLDRLRAERRRAHHESQATLARQNGTAPSPEPDADEARWLTEQLTGLRDDERELLVLRVGQDRTLRDAGAAVGLNVPTAHGRLRRLLARLRGTAQGGDR